MKTIAGIDIGNSTTEICLAQLNDDGKLRFLGSASTATTGIKGTSPNTAGILTALTQAAQNAGIDVSAIDLALLNEAAPVIGGTAMETVTETIITGSSMLGHNPHTPAGGGAAAGRLVKLANLPHAIDGEPLIVTADETFGFEEIAARLNAYAGRASIVGLILQADEAVLVTNRLQNGFRIPIVDEVRRIDRLPEGHLAAIEVALPGETVRMLSNPYGVATLLGLDAAETQRIVPITKSLTGNRSAVVVKTPDGNVKENVLPAGNLLIHDASGITHKIAVDKGADAIMATLAQVDCADIYGEPNTNTGEMLAKMRRGMGDATNGEPAQIRDILAVDTMAPILVSGALAGEVCMEKAVGIAAMAVTQKLPMRMIADALYEKLGIYTSVAGVEAVMASLGALTTPGTSLPLAILDLGGGSTDAAVLDKAGTIRSVHLAGAGELVTLLIQTELGLEGRQLAEDIKRYPLAKVESLFHIRLETGEIQFYEERLPAQLFGGVVLLIDGKLSLIEKDIPMERLVQTRREAKAKVFVPNALRVLRSVAEEQDLRRVPNVVLVGGSAEDFEIPQLLAEALRAYGIVCGRGNIRQTEGPRNAVATGLCMIYAG